MVENRKARWNDGFDLAFDRFPVRKPASTGCIMLP